MAVKLKYTLYLQPLWYGRSEFYLLYIISDHMFKSEGVKMRLAWFALDWLEPECCWVERLCLFVCAYMHACQKAVQA